MRRRIWIAILISSFGWGTGGVATRAAFGQGVPPYALALLRTMVALTLAVVAVFGLWRRRVSMDSVTLRVGLVAGVGNIGLPLILFTLAYEHASAGFVGLLTALIPVTTAVMAHYWLPDEPLSLSRIAGLLVAFGGVAVLLLSGDSGLAEGGRPLQAAWLSLSAVVLVSAAGVYSKRYANRYEPLDVTGFQFLFGALVIAVGMFALEGAPGAQTASGWGLIAYLGMVSTFIPFALYYWILRYVSATYAVIPGYLIPFIAVLSGVLLLDEQVGWGIAAGGLLILIGVIITERGETVSEAA
jgi:drug/metabolite transporter (DMT)-like permease